MEFGVHGNHHHSTEGMINMQKTVGKESSMKLVLCDCGKLHLTYGALTLHLTRDEFLVFSESIRRLATIVAQPPVGQHPATLRSSPSEVCH